MDKEIIVAICLGIGLSASAGFRVFVPLLIASVAAKLGWLPITEGFAWLNSWAAIACFGSAMIVEIIAYYIPFVDNLLDTIAIPLAVGAGTLLSASVLPVDSHMLKWITSLFIGGGTAALVQGGTSLTRLFSSKFTGGTGNFLVSTGENVAAVGFPVFALLVPVFFAVVVVLFLILIVYGLKSAKRMIPNKSQTGKGKLN